RKYGLVRENDTDEPAARAVAEDAAALVLADREGAIDRDRPSVEASEHARVQAILVVVLHLHRVLVGVREADAKDLEDAVPAEIEIELLRLRERVRVRAVAHDRGE